MTQQRAAVGERRQQIEDVASALFGERGYAATSMRDIAGAMDLRGASLYAHVTSKQDVLWTIVEHASYDFRRALRPIVNGVQEQLPPSLRLRAMIDAHVAVVTGALDRANVFLFEWTFLDPPRRARIARRRDEYEGWFREVIEEGMRQGEFDGDTDPKLAAIYILSALNGLAQWFRPGGRLSAEVVADYYADLFLDGLHTDEGDWQ